MIPKHWLRKAEQKRLYYSRQQKKKELSSKDDKNLKIGEEYIFNLKK